MRTLLKGYVFGVLAWPLSSAATCSSDAGSSLPTPGHQDETSLLQTRRTVTQGDERLEKRQVEEELSAASRHDLPARAPRHDAAKDEAADLDDAGSGSAEEAEDFDEMETEFASMDGPVEGDLPNSRDDLESEGTQAVEKSASAANALTATATSAVSHESQKAAQEAEYNAWKSEKAATQQAFYAKKDAQLSAYYAKKEVANRAAMKEWKSRKDSVTAAVIEFKRTQAIKWQVEQREKDKAKLARWQKKKGSQAFAAMAPMSAGKGPSVSSLGTVLMNSP